MSLRMDVLGKVAARLSRPQLSSFSVARVAAATSAASTDTTSKSPDDHAPVGKVASLSEEPLKTGVHREGAGRRVVGWSSSSQSIVLQPAAASN